MLRSPLQGAVWLAVQGAVAGAHMVQCFHKAGLPPGVVNFVTGLLKSQYIQPCHWPAQDIAAA